MIVHDGSRKPGAIIATVRAELATPRERIQRSAARASARPASPLTSWPRRRRAAASEEAEAGLVQAEDGLVELGPRADVVAAEVRRRGAGERGEGERPLHALAFELRGGAIGLAQEGARRSRLGGGGEGGARAEVDAEDARHLHAERERAGEARPVLEEARVPHLPVAAVEADVRAGEEVEEVLEVKALLRPRAHAGLGLGGGALGIVLEQPRGVGEAGAEVGDEVAIAALLGLAAVERDALHELAQVAQEPEVAREERGDRAALPLHAGAALAEDHVGLIEGLGALAEAADAVAGDAGGEGHEAESVRVPGAHGDGLGAIEEVVDAGLGAAAVGGEKGGLAGEGARDAVRLAGLEREEEVLGLEAGAADGVDEGEAERGRPADVDPREARRGTSRSARSVNARPRRRSSARRKRSATRARSGVLGMSRRRAAATARRARMPSSM